MSTQDITKFYTLSAMAEQTGLSKDYLRELADQRKIPCLNVRGRRRFNPGAVQSALDRLAEQGATDGKQ
jgi:excisionase family DNA binding protein